jgi:hypothetical protein
MCQVVYFSYVLYAKPSLVSNSITSLKMVTGYRSIFYDETTDGEVLYPFCETTEMSRQVLENSTVWFAVMGLILVLAIIVFLKEYYDLKDTYCSEKRSLISHCLRSNSCQYMYNCFIFPIIVFNFIINTVAVNLNSIRLVGFHDFFDSYVNSVCLLVTWLSSSFVFASELLLIAPKGKGRGVCGTQHMSDLYVPIFMFKMMAFSFLLVLGMWMSFEMIVNIMAGLFCLSFLTLLALRPYESIFSNLTIILCESTSTYALAMAALNDKI